MPKTTLLLREPLSSSSLTSIVAKSQNLRPPFSEYNLDINSSQLEITLLPKSSQPPKPIQADEGFESDIDSISIVSSDDSFTSSTCLVEDHVLKTRENDSAHGSSSSESDNELCVVKNDEIVFDSNVIGQLSSKTVKESFIAKCGPCGGPINPLGQLVSKTDQQNVDKLSKDPNKSTKSSNFIQIRDQIEGQINVQIKSQLTPNINSNEPHSLESNLGRNGFKLQNLKRQTNQLGQLGNSVGQLPSNTINTRLNPPLSSQVDSPFNPKPNYQLNSPLNSPLNSQLNSQISSPLNSQFNSPLNTQLNSLVSPQIVATNTHNSKIEKRTELSTFKTNKGPQFNPQKNTSNPEKNPTSVANSSTHFEVHNTPVTSSSVEYYPLQEVLCYTDVNFPKVLIFVTKIEVLVFNFDNLEILQSFYTNFNTLKAVTNQRTYARINTKFNLLQRTDNNGVTHIEISREPGTKIILPDNKDENSSSIISINTPEVKIESRLGNKPETIDRNKFSPIVKPKQNTAFFDDSKISLQSELRTSRSEFYPTSINSFTLRPKNKNGDISDDDKNLRKVWNSAEDILDAPKRPERRQRAKRRAPLPPVDQKTQNQPLNPPLNQREQNILKGQYVRVAVDPKKNIDVKLLNEKPNFQTFSSNVQTFTPNWNNIKAPQSPLILTTVSNKPQNRSSQNFKPDLKPKTANWTNSVPRLLRKPRSKSETRLAVTPMAYRYIDTTTSKPPLTSSSQTISNRLFGLSQKLKEFGTNVVGTKSYSNFYDGSPDRRNSVGEMTYKAGSTENNLKSVIKKQDDRKNNKNEKKVTFSAYATVQVV